MSRRSDHALNEGDNLPQTVLQAGQLLQISADRSESDLVLQSETDEMVDGFDKTSLLAQIRNALVGDDFAKLIRNSPTEKFAFRDDDLLYIHGLVYIPVVMREKVIKILSEVEPAEVGENKEGSIKGGSNSRRNVFEFTFL